MLQRDDPASRQAALEVLERVVDVGERVAARDEAREIDPPRRLEREQGRRIEVGTRGAVQ
jgi:hypothetical protein